MPDNHQFIRCEPRHRNQRLTDFARQLRKGQTPAEAKLWKILQSVQHAGYKFRRQHPVEPFIADFCCLKAKLIVELDGDAHVGQEARDAKRDERLVQSGFEILRFWNSEVFDDESRVLEAVLFRCRSRIKLLSKKSCDGSES